MDFARRPDWLPFAVMPMGDTEPFAQNRSIRMAGGVKQPFEVHLSQGEAGRFSLRVPKE